MEELHEDTGISEEDQYLLSVFEKANVVLKVGNVRLHVKKEHLIAQSEVFEKMFSPGFKEATADEIVFKEKDPLTFIRFLRYLLPGFQDQLEEDIVHNILPLVQEYQTDSLLKRIDIMLADLTKRLGDSTTTDRTIQNILEAEQYEMPQYLIECINVASKKIHENLTNNANFVYVTQDTKFKICMTRISLIDSVYKKNNLNIRSLNQYMATN